MAETFVLPFGIVILLTLVSIAFVSGIGITTIGPGGIFVTIALYALTPLHSSTIAGTVQVAFIATGIVGSVAYVHSGEISGENVLSITLLGLGSVIGALFGAWLNGFVSRDLFGVLLGTLAGVTGLYIIYQERHSLTTLRPIYPRSIHGKVGYIVLGYVLGTLSGLLGVGGPVLAVPALVLIGTPMLHAVAIAQFQSIIIAVFAATGYLVQGSVSIIVAIVVGVPLVGGVVVGWRIAHRINPERLTVALGIALIVIAPILAL